MNAKGNFRALDSRGEIPVGIDGLFQFLLSGALKPARIGDCGLPLEQAPPLRIAIRHYGGQELEPFLGTQETGQCLGRKTGSTPHPVLGGTLRNSRTGREFCAGLKRP